MGYSEKFNKKYDSIIANFMESEADIARMDALMEVFKEKAEKGISKEDEKIFEKYSKEVDILKNYRDKFIFNNTCRVKNYHHYYPFPYNNDNRNLNRIADYYLKDLGSKKIKKSFDKEDNVKTFEIVFNDYSKIRLSLYMIRVGEWMLINTWLIVMSFSGREGKLSEKLDTTCFIPQKEYEKVNEKASEAMDKVMGWFGIRGR